MTSATPVAREVTSSAAMFGLTLLQSFWVAQIGLSVLNLFLMVARGSFYDKSYGDRDPDAPIGWLKFRKHLALYYSVGLVTALWIGWNMTWTCFGWEPSQRFMHALEYLTGSDASGTDALHICLAQTLLEFQLIRRFYESFSQSIFSGRQVWGPIMVLFCFLNNIATGFSIVADTTTFETGFECFKWSSLTWRPLVAIPLFIWATKIHHQTHLKLAKLRKNRAGHVVTSAYKMPKGDWFDSVSSPHYFAEIVIYVSIGLLLGSGACTWWLLTAYVTITNALLGYSTHTWYLQKFEDYPKDRKMLIPFLL